MKVKTLVIMTLGISIGLMFFTLTQEAYCTAEGCMHSMMAFTFGVFGLFIGGNETLTWFANPLLILAWVFIKNRKLSFLLSLLSTSIALLFLVFDEVVITEAGHSSILIKYALGYWLWIGSHATMVLGNVLIIINEHSYLKTETKQD
ncbi:hypothetical protein [Psychrobacter sp. H8-1]|uniref:hypothetical protein n=1 Tax=Psychrobacter sp. H8-1 TaxID=2774129 RepID=UPI00191B7555|nr:hypothetical protein [Psychrobacter sp. H8-1]